MSADKNELLAFMAGIPTDDEIRIRSGDGINGVRITWASNRKTGKYKYAMVHLTLSEILSAKVDLMEVSLEMLDAQLDASTL